MARIFITGSTDGLGLAAAETLLRDGHEVIVHARSGGRLPAVQHLLDRGARCVLGDLAMTAEVRQIADQVNGIGGIDAVIHNAGVLSGPALLPVNVVAPYLLTVLIPGPRRLVYLSSGMHRGGTTGLDGLDWAGRTTTASYSTTKLHVTALSAALARLVPHVASNAVDPGWVAGQRRMTWSWATGPRNGWPPAMIPRQCPAAATGSTGSGKRRIPPPTTPASRTPCWPGSRSTPASAWAPSPSPSRGAPP